ncbi:MAG: VCBS repeat-containing protein [candidate division Zixibacteria bacterium]|nr:VCBS repeat-containing protein [candidate division Zixibacteria bacterium]
MRHLLLKFAVLQVDKQYEMNKKLFCVMLWAIVFLPLSNSFPQPQFDTWTTYWTGRQTSSVFVEDLNDDGYLDLAVSNLDDSNVSIMLNNGNGTFAAKQDYTVALRPSSVIAHDLDNDGDQDLVTACAQYDTVVSVLKNNGNGSFNTRIDYPAGKNPTTVWVADLDGDGDGDLITGSYGGLVTPSKNVSVLKNNGDGTFTNPIKYMAGNNPFRLTASDVDGDGDQDIITANNEAWLDSSEIVSVLINNGDGTFADGIGYGADSSSQNFAISVCASDFDGDGDKDLAVAVQRSPANSVVSVLKNDGAGNFGPKTNYVVGNYPHYIYAADLDNDGDEDLAVAFSAYAGEFGKISVLKNNGDGTFASGMEYPTGAFPVSLMAKDMDGDGNKDIISATYDYDGGATILKNKGDGTFAERADYNVGTSPRGVSSSDLNGDGYNDLAVANVGEQSVSILTNNGNGSFQPKVNYNANGYPVSIFSSDIDGDGDRDLLTAQPGTRTFSVFSNDGNSGFNARADYISSTSPNLITSSDLDGDGDQDVVVVSYNGYEISVFKNEGGGLLGTPVGYNPGNSTYEISLADLDGDGDPDLASAAYYGKIYKNNGDGTFGSAVPFPVGSCPESILSGDLDGDGDLDLAAMNYCHYSFISVFTNYGDANFATNVDYSGGPTTAYTNPKRITAADLNGDGNNDLIMVNLWTRTVSVITNKGDGTFDQPVGYGVGARPYSVTASDLDNDGDIDLAVTNDSSNTVSILINQTNTCTKLGDLNHDCYLTVSDIVMELNCIFQGLGNCPLNISDVNCGGSLSAADIVLLLQAVFSEIPLNCP